MIKLVQDTINREDINALVEWLNQDPIPQLTMGEMTEKYEKEFSRWLGCKYSIAVNSGSSANLLMLYSLIAEKCLKNNYVVVPAVSWATSVAPIIQLGLTPIFCDADYFNLGIDCNQLERIIKKYNPAALLLVHVLGFSCNMDKIKELCDMHGTIILEDCCETMGSTYNGKKVGQTGLMSTFSSYFGHIFSTVEGGCVCTNNKRIANILKMLRAHGWTRNLEKEDQERFQKINMVSNFKSLYTFNIPGFNVRPTEIQSFLGLRQLERLDQFIYQRHINLRHYDRLLRNNYWKVQIPPNDITSNFAYPIISYKREDIIHTLQMNDIEYRPLIAGNMLEQPFIRNCPNIIKAGTFSMAEQVESYGFYVPNNPDLKEEEIKQICDIVNTVIETPPL